MGRKPKPFNFERYLHPSTTLECIDDAKLKRAIIRRAAQYVLSICDEQDRKQEAEIKARNNDKEIEAWYNQPRHHDKKLLEEAKEVIEVEFLKKIRDERRLARAYDIFHGVFSDLQGFKKELGALAKKRKPRTQEIQTAFVPSTVSWSTYYQALDKGATIDVAVADLVGPVSVSAKNVRA